MVILSYAKMNRYYIIINNPEQRQQKQALVGKIALIPVLLAQL